MDLVTSGKKSELLQRLLDSGLDREVLGLSAVIEEIVEEKITEGEVIFSLEDDETITPDIEPEEELPVKQKEEVLEAEILDADLVEMSEEVHKSKSEIKPVKSKQVNQEKTNDINRDGKKTSSRSHSIGIDNSWSRRLVLL